MQVVERSISHAQRQRQDRFWLELLVIFTATLAIVGLTYLSFGLMPAAILLCVEMGGALAFGIK
jgi:hypothetical protein